MTDRPKSEELKQAEDALRQSAKQMRETMGEEAYAEFLADFKAKIPEMAMDTSRRMGKLVDRINEIQKAIKK